MGIVHSGLDNVKRVPMIGQQVVLTVGGIGKHLHDQNLKERGN
jgi:hypothetical protein